MRPNTTVCNFQFSASNFPGAALQAEQSSALTFCRYKETALLLHKRLLYSICASFCIWRNQHSGICSICERWVTSKYLAWTLKIQTCLDTHIFNTQVCRAFRLLEKDAAGAWPSWPSQLLHGCQQRAYIAGAGASDRPPAFVFDIDGVLVRGKKVLDPARRAFERLYKDGGTSMPCSLCDIVLSSL